MNVAHLDFEARSGVDITEVGSHRWSIDPRFDLFMAAVSRDGDPHVYLWINPKFRTPDEMGENEEAERILEEADIVFAHNATNELANTWGALEQGKACPVKSWEKLLPKLRCTAAMARKAGLPHALDKLCTTLNVKDSKDRAGKALIQFFCIPDEETGLFNEPRDHPEKWAQFCNYCRQDVRAETECGQKLKAFELTGAALATFQFDLRMNQRGIPINVVAARNAQKIIDAVQSGVKEEFRALTGWNVTQRAKVVEWLKVNAGLEMPNMQGETIDTALEEARKMVEQASADGREDWAEIGRTRVRVLSMFQLVSYAAVKKIRVMLDCVCPDGRVRGAHMYYGAIRTGRWSGRLLQPQNFRKPDKKFEHLIHQAYQAICQGINAAMLDELYGPPLEIIANCIRHFIHHACALLDGDYNAIEGRIGCWIAGQEDILEDWRNGKDLYKRAVAFVEKMHEADVTKPQRQFGKVVELACQFGLGTEGFMRTCDAFGIKCDEEKARRAVHEYYRPTHEKIVARWYQHDSWVRDAITYPTTEQGPWVCKKVAGMMYLFLRLPSGRALAYPNPQINKREPNEKERAEMADGKYYPEKRFLEITFWGNIAGATWGRQKLHGSLCFENEVQGIAADFMAHGALNAERLGMPPFMLVHDQGLALQDKGQTEEAFAAALADLPSWAKGFPMKVEAGVTPYFTKE